MKFSGTRQLSASREEVWTKLNDPIVLRRCIPGCERLEKISDTQLTAAVTLTIGPIKARFSGDVQLQNLDPPEAYSIIGSGKAGAAGTASGRADVRLVAVGEGTELTYDVDAKVGGKIAQLGTRLIDATTARLTNQFFDNFASEVMGSTTEATDELQAKTANSVTRLRPWVRWAFAVAVIVAIGILYGLS